MGGIQAQLLLVATAGVYFGLNTVLNVSNRWLLGVKGFSFPATLTIMHMLFSAAVLTLFVKSRGGGASPPPKGWRGVAAVGCAQGANVGLNNLSLVFLPLSMAQLIRPIATAVVVGCRNKVWPSKVGSLSLVMMVAGIGLCIDQHGSQSDGSLLGIAVAFASVISAGIMLVCSSALMAADSVDPVALTCYSAPWSAMALAPFALVMEAPRHRRAASAKDNSSGLTGVALAIVASCAAASTYNICANSLLRQTSAVWMTVFGQFRLLVLLVVASFSLPGESDFFSTRTTVGCALVLAGVCLHAHTSKAPVDIKQDDVLLSKPHRLVP